MLRTVFFLCMIPILFSGCKSPSSRPHHARPISVGMAHNLMLQQMGHPSFKIIDVRTPDEFSSGHITGAINIDWNSNKQALRSLSTTDTLLLYCRSGRRSQLAMTYLAEHGFQYLFHMEGGLIEWKKDIKNLTPSPLNEH